MKMRNVAFQPSESQAAARVQPLLRQGGLSIVRPHQQPIRQEIRTDAEDILSPEERDALLEQVAAMLAAESRAADEEELRDALSDMQLSAILELREMIDQELASRPEVVRHIDAHPGRDPHPRPVRCRCCR